MGRSVEKSGKSVNDAIAAALSELNLTIDDVHVDVLNEGKAGIFGLLSGKTARVRVSELEEDERVPQPGYTGAERTNANKSTISNTANIAGNSQNVTAGYNVTNGHNGGAASGSSAGAGPDDPASIGPEHYEADADADADDGESPGASPGDDLYGEETDDGEYSDDQEFDYEYEIDRAIGFLNELWKGIHVSTDMNAEPADDGFLINVESDDSGILIGHRGETLDAIQYLLNLYMNKGRSEFIRISIDIENYKKKREAALVRLAGQMADKVVRLRRNFTMDAMNSYERRIIHSVLQNHPKVETYSIGEDPNRKVVITLKNRGGYSSR